MGAACTAPAGPKGRWAGSRVETEGDRRWPSWMSQCNQAAGRWCRDEHEHGSYLL